MRTFLQAMIVAAVVLGLSSCGMMIFAPKNKPQAELVKRGLAEQPKEEVSKELKEEVKDEGKEELADTAKLELQNSFDDVWMAAMSVIKRSGLATMTDQRKGVIEAKIQIAKVTVNITKISAGVADIEIKAVKDKQPEVELASELLIKIKAQLEQ